MATDKQRLTFISYSRANKDFALQLAKELRSSGFNIWLDQLDIPTGSRWDDEVESALVRCDIFMIILTHNSIASNNVKDEIGYAIDSNKRILPILLENVNVPFRLRRFQYVDFTGKTYPEGIESAKQLLGILVNEPTLPKNELTVSKPDVISKLPGGPTATPPRSKLPSQSPEEPQPTSRFTKTLAFLLGAAVLGISCLVALWFIWPNLPGLKDPNSGALITEGPPPSPTTVLLPSSTASAVPTSTYTRAPTATRLPTYTAVFTATDKPTATQIIQKDPSDFLINYFNVVIYNKDFNKGWSLLTTDYQIQKANGWDSFTSFWNSVKSWDYSNIKVEYNDNTRALVLISYTLYYFDSNTPPSPVNGVRYCLLQASNPETWQIDLRGNCSQ